MIDYHPNKCYSNPTTPTTTDNKLLIYIGFRISYRNNNF